MLLNLQAQNFRKHADLNVNFTPGINAIRAANEQGKSSMLEAISYALFGARGLKEALEHVVTYDMPVSKLKVTLTFDQAGRIYVIRRSKAGAELDIDGRTEVTGQTEVTKFVEKLLASQDMAAKLMLARQKSLAGALSDGPTAAGKMIEDLANLDLIDQLIGLVSEKLDAGNTSAQVALVGSLRQGAAPADLPDLAPLEAAHKQAELAAASARSQRAAAQAQLERLDVQAANAILAEEKSVRQNISTAAYEIEMIEPKLRAALPAAPAPKDLAAARAAVEAEKSYSAAARMHAELVAADTAEQWDQPMETLQAEIVKTRNALQQHTDFVQTMGEHIAAAARKDALDVSAYQVEKTKLEGMLIRETTCALCQKDLADVPEVVSINSRLSTQLEQLATAEQARVAEAEVGNTEMRRQLDHAQFQLREAQEYLEALRAVARHNDKVELLYARAGDLVTLDRRCVPAQWKWAGPLISPDRPDVAGELVKLERAEREAVTAAAERRQLEKQLADLKAKKDALVLSLASLQIDEAKDTLKQAEELGVQLAHLREKEAQAVATLHAADRALEVARAAHRQAELQAAQAREQLAAAEKRLADMEANNLLQKKLREARPAITDKLWAGVLAAVSTYLADVRGEPSTITRKDGAFLINGRPVTGLSGSAEDALGLAIRFALTKTFLPNVDFAILDEVAAACDDQRELAMLGLLATSGFAQIILVTHSEHADAFAQNIITF